MIVVKVSFLLDILLALLSIRSNEKEFMVVTIQQNTQEQNRFKRNVIIMSACIVFSMENFLIMTVQKNQRRKMLRFFFCFDQHKQHTNKYQQRSYKKKLFCYLFVGLVCFLYFIWHFFINSSPAPYFKL